MTTPAAEPFDDDDEEDDDPEQEGLLAMPVPGVCRLCGCTNETPCVNYQGVACHWVAPSLCSHCVDAEVSR